VRGTQTSGFGMGNSVGGTSNAESVRSQLDTIKNEIEETSVHQMKVMEK